MSEFVTIIAIGSLLSEDSAKQTCPSLRNFRLGKIHGYGRIFNKVDPNSENFESAHIATCALIEREDHTSLITLFEIEAADYPAFIQREFDYELRSVEYTELETGKKGQGIACCALASDDAFQAYIEQHPVQKEHYEACRVQSYTGQVWRKDIFPRPEYLAFCLEAAQALGENYVENILNYTYLADESTTLATYLSEHASKIDHIREIKWLEDFIETKS